ncbi:MAG TPA: 16S rRNA (cytosine(967)-C(5))-methyltransferase RsmB [Papillibacter sp.]|nr:16S rRNA (cytosine(967)-C(5))-methyltransferase RsmB [Papillibacter sp.]
MPVNARDAALAALMTYRRTGRHADAVLKTAVKAGLDVRDAALATHIFYGVLQNMAYCDFIINSFSTIRTGRLEPQVLDILRLSVYQLVFLDKIPPSAAVSEGVRLAKKHANPRAAGLVNAVLRKIASTRDNLPKVRAATEAERLSIQKSHPLWLVETYLKQFGLEETKALLGANNTTPPVFATVNRLKATREQAIYVLQNAGITAEPYPFLEDTIKIYGQGKLESLKAFQDGLIYVQDPAARLCVTAAGLTPGMRVLDACAAPGGKTFAAAIDMGGEGKITSCDVSEKKVARIREGARRLGFGGMVTATVQDATRRREDFVQAFDAVIADVPCSGLGVIRKKPDIRYKAEEELRLLPDLQLRILTNLSEAVRPGGVLLYSTCTLLRRENEEVVEAFLGIRSNFAPEPFTLPEPFGAAPDGMMTLMGHKHDTDGFFICRMRRRP